MEIPFEVFPQWKASRCICITDSDLHSTGDRALSLTAVSQQGEDAKAKGSRSMNIENYLGVSTVNIANGVSNDELQFCIIFVRLALDSPVIILCEVQCMDT